MSTPTALVVQHDLAAPAYEVIPALMAKHAEDVIALAAPIVITDAASAEQANAVLLQLHNVTKEVANHAEKVKKPLNGLLKAVRECIDRAEAPLAAAKQSLQGKVAAWNREQARLLAEAQAKADEERRANEAKAAAEQKRFQDEANAKAAEETRLAQEKAAQQAKDLEDLIGTPQVAAPVAAVVAEVVKVQVAPVTTVVPTIAPSAVLTKQVPTPEVFDPKALAAAYEVAGEVLVDFRMGVIRRLLDAGLAVPGVRIVMKEQTAMRGTRS